jgi:hypothetical protein
METAEHLFEENMFQTAKVCLLRRMFWQSGAGLAHHAARAFARQTSTSRKSIFGGRD